MATSKSVPSTGASGLLSPYKRGALSLEHRVVYAPLTRSRSPGGVPQPIAATYYSQRASRGGLVVSEGVAISDTARGYPNVPGIWTDEQVAAWRPIVDAVHARGATFFAQLWHVGRVSLEAYQPGGVAPLAPSARPVADGATALHPETYEPTAYAVPHALTCAEIAEVVDTFRLAARHAVDAGFDGVEIHGANGYLIEQFLSDGTNDRDDEYGGSVEGRARFALEVVDAVVSEVGADRVGIRLSPYNTFMDSHHSAPVEQYSYLVSQLEMRKIVYIHMVEARVDGSGDKTSQGQSLAPFRRLFSGTFIAAGGYTQALGDAAVDSGNVDLVAFGRHFLANPDLPHRFAVGAPLNKYERATFYAPPPGKGLEAGYTDYPFVTLGEDSN